MPLLFSKTYLTPFSIIDGFAPYHHLVLMRDITIPSWNVKTRKCLRCLVCFIICFAHYSSFTYITEDSYCIWYGSVIQKVACPYRGSFKIEQWKISTILVKRNTLGALPLKYGNPIFIVSALDEVQIIASLSKRLFWEN